MKLAISDFCNNGILSHIPISEDLQKSYTIIRATLTRDFSNYPDILKKKLDILDQLSEFPLGKFLIQYQGLNGYWTKYIIENKKQPKNELEDFILNKSPISLATRESRNITIKWLQMNLCDNIKILSIPCGTMSDVLSLDFSEINNAKLIGVDLDFKSLKLAYEESDLRNVSDFIQLIQSDALSFDWKNVAHIVVSHGLNFYLSKEECELLYKNAFNSLMNGGFFIGSFMTAPPEDNQPSHWNTELIDPKDISYQRELFSIFSPRWRLLQTYNETTEILSNVGFKEIEIIEDSMRIMPTFIAKKV